MGLGDLQVGVYPGLPDEETLKVLPELVEITGYPG